MGLTSFIFHLASSTTKNPANLLSRPRFLLSRSKSPLPTFRNPENFRFNGGSRFLSTALQQETEFEKHPQSEKSLSSRMSFVFEQLDMIEKEKSGKDEALQQIRAWREKKAQEKRDIVENSANKGVLEDEFSGFIDSGSDKSVNAFKEELELVHPWPEWIEFMERLLQQNYFDHRRGKEDEMVENGVVDTMGFTEEGFDFTRDWFTVRTAVLNFGRDRFDILRSLSRKDIQILVGHGCPSVDTKVVYSAKVLRKHVHLDEGDVCSSCSLRDSCAKGYLLTRKEDEARTLDVVRVLLTYGFEPITGSLENKSLLKIKSVKSVVRKLLHEVVKLSAVPIDPSLPPPVIKKPPPKVKQPPPPPKKRIGRDDIEMKKGDWLCQKCDFMNFAKNNVCLQCDAKRPKRQLLPGEWECPKCNFLNYRRNMACFHCDHERPPDEFTENQLRPKQQVPRTRLERVTANIRSGSNSWNFDFDDNESDGADVAAFEYADPPRTDEEPSSDSWANRGSGKGFEDDPFETNPMQGIQERGRYVEPDRRKLSSTKSGTGFDDFDDEEDDIDSYVLDVPNNNSASEVSFSRSSRVKVLSASEDFDDSDDHSNSRQRITSHSFDNSGDDDQNFDSDEDSSNWKSSHIADSRSRPVSRTSPSRGFSFVSEDELLDSDSDDNDRGFRSKRYDFHKNNSNRKITRRGRGSDSEDGFLFDSESDDKDDKKSHRSRPGREKAGHERRGNPFRSGTGRDSRSTSNDMGRGRRNSFSDGDLDGSFRGSRTNSSRGDEWNDRVTPRGEYGGRSMNDRRGGLRDQGRSRGGEYGGRSMNGTRGGLRDQGRSTGEYDGRSMNDRRGGLRDQGRSRGQYGGSMNDRRGGFRDRDRSSRGEEYGLSQHGNHKGFNSSSGVRGFGGNRQREHRR